MMRSGRRKASVNTELVRQAENWLNETIQELSEDHDYKYSKEGWDLVFRMEHEIRKYAPELQQAVRFVLGRWLLGWNADKVHWALSLIRLLGATEHIGRLRRLRWRMRFFLSPLGREWIASVDNVLADLRDKPQE